MGLAEKSSSLGSERENRERAIESEYSGIFCIDPTPKSNKNVDLTVKNSSLYKLQHNVTLPKKIERRGKR